MAQHKVRVELPYDTVDSIIVQELSWQFRHIKPNDRPPMFSYDPEEDRRKVKRLRDAFKRVLRYYGGNV